MPRYYRRNVGFERAIAHIEAYERLQREIGSIVTDIKRIFFNLPTDDLSLLFSQYGDIYKENAKQYAIETFPKWKAGKRRMAGQTAERLINLVPQFLSTEQRFKLVEKLCEDHAPSDVFYAHLNLANPREGLRVIKSHLDNIQDRFDGLKHLPPHVTDRIKWLSEGDAVVARKILNELAFKKYRKSRELAAKELGNLMRSLESNELNLKAQYIIEILGYTIEIQIEKPKSPKRLLMSIIDKIW